MPSKARKVRKNQSFLQGAMILTISVAAVKIINGLFKIPLFWILGAEGTGYFTSAYSLYTLLYSLATAGFPIAISRMVSANSTQRRFRDVKKLHSVSIPLFICTGLLGFGLMFGGSFIYAQAISSPGVIYSTLALSPTVFFYCMMSIYRGYYEGMRNMYPTAISEVIESICKLIIGLSCAYLVLKLGMSSYYNTGTVLGVAYETEALARSAVLPLASAGAILGTTAGSFFGFLFLMIRHKIVGDGITDEELENSPDPRESRETLNTLVKIAIPVALGALVMNISDFIDSLFIQNRLTYIMNTSPNQLISIYTNLISEKSIPFDKLATTLYGCYGSASSIMMLIPSITSTFGISALPSVTAAWTDGNRLKIKSSIESVIRITTLVTIPAGLTLSIMAHPISQFLYLKSDNQSEVAVIGNILTLLGIAGIFLATATPLCSMLQAIGRVDLPVKLLAIGVVVKVFIDYTFVSIPQINVQGAGTGTLICYIFITLAALYFLYKETKVMPNLKSVFLKPFLSGVSCAVSALLMYWLLSQLIAIQRVDLLASLIFAVVVYIISLFVFKSITKSDILMLPKGQKVLRNLEKHHLMR